jgi:hypothetical protein
MNSSGCHENAADRVHVLSTKSTALSEEKIPYFDDAFRFVTRSSFWSFAALSFGLRLRPAGLSRRREVSFDFFTFCSASFPDSSKMKPMTARAVYGK